MNIKVTINPTKRHLNEINKWLKEEYELSKDGFFCNWNNIESSYNENKLIVITENNFAIGFFTFYFNNHIVNIQIAEVKPDKRKKGIGKKLLLDSFNWFVKSGALIAQLYCSPPESEKIWKKIGFRNFPNGIIKETRIYLYKVLVETTNLYKGGRKTELIELWNIEDYKNELNSKWKWEVKRKENSNELIKPIIHPSSDEWSVSHKIGSEIKEKTIKKNFDMKRHDYGNFLIIKQLAKL